MNNNSNTNISLELLMSTPTTTKLKFSHGFRLSASIFYDLLLIISLAMNLFQLAVFIRGHKILKTTAFFIISWQMLFNNLLTLGVMITFMTSIIFSDSPAFSKNAYFFLSFVECFAYNGLLLFAFLLTLNRLMVFAFPKIAKFFFNGPRFFGLIAICWCLTAWMATGIMLSPCPIIAKPEDLGFGSGCISDEANIYNYIGQYVATYFPVFMIFAYALIYIEIKIGIFCNPGNCCNFGNLFRKSMVDKNRLAEIKLLLQAGLICSTFFIQNFCWTYLPYITANISSGEELIFVAIMLSSILLYSVDAIVIFSFNSTIKRAAASFFPSKNGNRIFHSQINTRSISLPATMEFNQSGRISVIS